MRVGLDYRAAAVAPCSGIGRQIQALEQALRTRTDTQLVLLSEAPLDHPMRQSACCPAWGSSMDGLQRPQVRLRFERKFLPSMLHQQAIDLFIATANMGLPIGHKPAGTRYVLVLHDLFQMTQESFHTSRLRAMINKGINAVSIIWSVWIADQIWCPSQYSCNEAARLFPWAKPKLRVFYNMVPEHFEEPGELPQGLPCRYWLLVGTREPRKNVAFFIKNWYACRLDHPEVPDLVLVGCATDLPAQLSNLPGLHWLNDLPEHQMHTLYHRAEYLWQPSFAEGFGLPVVEALSFGTPVVVAEGSALDEVTPADTCRFAPHDTQQLRATLLQLAQTGAAPDRQSLRDWAKKFSEPAYRRRLDTLLGELYR